jgi:2'-5' RNA ligase
MGTWIEAPLWPAELLAGGLSPRRLPAAPHVTLVHFGDQAPPDSLLRDVMASAIRAVPGHVRRLAEASGTAEFLMGDRGFRLPVLIINSGYLCHLRHVLIEAMDDEGIRPDDAYGFVPHMTMAAATLGHYRLERRFPVTIDRMDLVTSKNKNETGRWSLPLP